MREELSPLRMSLSLRAERSNLHPDRTAMEIAAQAIGSERESMPVRPAFALSLLIRVSLRLHFLGPGRHTRRRNARPRKGSALAEIVATIGGISDVHPNFIVARRDW
jgi:hypothetical protein